MSCAKCGGRKATTRYQARFVWPPAPRGFPTRWPPCTLRRCPSGEHLHRTCEGCGFGWIDPVLGAALGAPQDGPPPWETPPRPGLVARLRAWLGWAETPAPAVEVTALKSEDVAGWMERELRTAGYEDGDERCADPHCGRPRLEHPMRGHVFVRRVP